MSWAERGWKVSKVLLILAVLAVFFVPTIIAAKYVALWEIYSHFVAQVSNITGVNRYLITAASTILFVPFFVGINFLLSFRTTRRMAGSAILMTMWVLYNVGLYYGTKDAYFAFAKGETLKWCAITPEGVKCSDRPGVDPTYGIPLQAVTPEKVKELLLLQKGEFKPIDPTKEGKPFFNPLTGEPQVWYYKYPDGTVEFYDKPISHPITGARLRPVTQEIILEWRQKQQSKAPGNGTGGHRVEGGVVPGKERRAGLVQVRSDPEDADTYVDWKARGRTPAALEAKDDGGLLVVVKEGHRAGFRRITMRDLGDVEFKLPGDVARSRTRLLLVPGDGASGEAVTSVRGRLIEEGFTVLGLEEAKEFQRELGRAGGLSHRGFRAWARARFDTDLLVTARFRQTSRELSEKELDYLGVRDAVKGVVRAEVGIDLEVVDLRSGDHLVAVSGKGSGFALDRGQGFQKALTQAATESARQLRGRLQG